MLAWRTADLIGPDQWRLSGLLRGLNGTLALAGTEDSVIVLADDRLLPIPLSSDQIGVELYWQIGSAEPFLFTFSAEFEPDT